MAYSSVRVQFEIGHEASVRTKKTPEGFTHDWEVFVRGADNTDIQCFVEKVVFHLHETFPKPRRVIKEPPYVVKESGYAGFVLPIDVYLKNKEEPKKISFQYDLTLQSSGPPISRVLREPRLFQNPSEDFRRKLIRGGGVGVDTPSEIHTEEPKLAPTMPPNKSKPTESPLKKHKPELPLNDSFAELFGTPIRRVPEQKKLPEVKKLSEEKKKPIKPYDKEILKEKEKYPEKDRKDRDKSKEKSKRPPSLVPPPPPPSVPTPPPQVIKSKDEHKKHEEKDKKKEEYKRKEEKEKKEKTKEPEKLQDHKKEKKEIKDDYAKKLNSKPPDPKPNYEKHNSELIDKEKERLEKEKHKHRHKKKEKEKSRDKEKYRKEKEKDAREPDKDKSSKKRHEEVREKEEKKRKSRSPSPAAVQIKKGPLNALLDELGSSDSASPLSDEESIPPVKLLPKPAKIVPEIKPQPVANVTKPKSTNPIEPERPKLNEESIKIKKEKSKKKQEEKKKEEHRVRSPSSEREEEEEEEEKERKEEKLEKERLEEEKPKSKDKENRKRKREKSEEKHVKPKKEASQSEEMQEEVRRPDKFTKEYVAQLKDLQHRIMTLEDNAELQKVVKVIAETGQYEITKKTFDFDLCALDIETVKRLQEFFSPT